MQQANKKYSIWAIILSVVAIILTQTQLRPFYTYFDKAKLTTSVDQNLYIYHNFGNIVFQHYIQIKNVGKAPTTTSRMYYYLKKLSDNTCTKLLTANISLSWTGDKTNPSIQYPILETYLLPDHIVQGNVLVYQTLSDAENREIEILKREIEKDIRNKKDSNLKQQTYINYILREKVNNLISKNLQGFTIGEYILFIVVMEDNHKIINPKKYYTFNVYESDMLKMQDITDDYQSGGNGIFYFKTTSTAFTATLYAKNDEETVNILLQEIADIAKKNNYR